MAFERGDGRRVVFFDSTTQQRLCVLNFRDEDKLTWRNVAAHSPT
jgi:hypothetical protein